MAETVDLRGRQAAAARVQVLADASGRRARLLARAGRATAIVFVLWLAGLALAGIGILPPGDVPLGHVIAGPARPAHGAEAEQPLGGHRASTAAALLQARRAPTSPITSAADARHSRGSPSAGALGAPTGANRPGSTSTGAPAASTPSRHGPSTAAGQSVKQSAPGHTKIAAPGNSANAPGQVKKTITTTSLSPGHSVSAPGRTGARSRSRNGHNG
jgi:hypothetical protein